MHAVVQDTMDGANNSVGSKSKRYCRHEEMGYLTRAGLAHKACKVADTLPRCTVSTRQDC